MGRSHSKLSPDHVSDLEKNTHCELPNRVLLSSPVGSPSPTVTHRELQKW